VAWLAVDGANRETPCYGLQPIVDNEAPEQRLWSAKPWDDGIPAGLNLLANHEVSKLAIWKSNK